jgi:hypothetical protein
MESILVAAGMSEAAAAATAAGISQAATVASIGTTVVGAVNQSKAYEAQAAQYEDEAETARVAALQDEVRRRQQLASVLATQQSIRAGSGGELFSGSVRNATIKAAEKDIRISQLNYLKKQRSFGLGAAQSRASASSAMVAGFGSAASQFAELE